MLQKKYKTNRHEDISSTPPKENRYDALHTTAQALISAIPFVGGSAAELFNAIITPPLTKRRDQWIQSIANGLIELQAKDKSLSIESLSENERFITAVMHASQIAMRSHQKEKLEALKNAVLNVAANKSINEDLQLIYLHLIDTLTPWHIRLLKYFNSPKEIANSKGFSTANRSMGSVGQVIDGTFPELCSDQFFRNQLVLDLFNHGLITMEVRNLNFTVTGEGMFDKHSTSIGDNFLEFIS